MGTTIHGRLIVALSLAMLAATNAQDKVKAPKRVIAESLPALTLPDKPSVEKPHKMLEPSAAIPKRAVLIDKHGTTNADLAVASAPLNTVVARLLMWGTPHGTYMNELRQSILKADAAGDFAERDRLFATYQPWAEKYLDPDSTTWSRDRLYPGGTPIKQPE